MLFSDKKTDVVDQLIRKNMKRALGKPPPQLVEKVKKTVEGLESKDRLDSKPRWKRLRSYRWIKQ